MKMIVLIVLMTVTAIQITSGQQTPAQVRLKESVDVSISRDGKVIGSVTYPVGTIFSLVSVQGNQLFIRYGERSVKVDAKKTDYAERLAASVQNNSAEIVKLQTVVSTPTQQVNSYVLDGSIGTTPLTPPLDKYDPFTPINVKSWTGEKFILMPEMTEGGKRSAYLAKRSLNSQSITLPYEDYVGKVLTIKKVSLESEFTGSYNLYVQIDATKEDIIFTTVCDYIHHFALKRDMDYARQHFIGKTLWLRSRSVSAYNAETKEETYFKVKNLQPVMVVNVVLSNYESWPLTFILKSVDGKVFMNHIKLSGTNCAGSEAFEARFEDTFFLQDPRNLFVWDESIFRALENGRILLGMTKEQVAISWGNPSKINRMKSKGANTEQWVYFNEKYIYFDADKVVTIQD